MTIEGTPESAAFGRGIVDEIRHVDGVVAVRDRLSYPRAVREAPAVGPLF